MEISLDEMVLAGLDETFGSAIKKMDGAVRKLIAANVGASKNRKHFLERLPQLDEKILQGLLSGRLQISDAVYYSTRSIGVASNVKLFEENDTKSKGFRNVDKAKLSEDRPLVLSEMQLLYHSGGSAITAANAGIFTPKAYTAEILGGDWKLRVDSKDIYEEMPVCGTFAPGLHPSASSVTALASGAQSGYTQEASFAYATNKPYGLYELGNPKLVQGNKRIEFEIEFAAALSDTNHVFKLMMIGTTVRPN